MLRNQFDPARLFSVSMRRRPPCEEAFQVQQIYRWRERLDERQSPTAFLPVSIAPDSVPLSPAAVLDQASHDHSPAAMLDRSPRVEIVLSAGRRIIAEGGVDIDAMLKLARGLEALR